MALQTVGKITILLYPNHYNNLQYSEPAGCKGFPNIKRSKLLNEYTSCQIPTIQFAKKVTKTAPGIEQGFAGTEVNRSLTEV